MLTENDVVESVSGFLASRGYDVVQQLTTDVRGIDVVAVGEAETWYVEAKGATSSKATTARFGTPFSTNQINSHVSRAIYTAMKILERAPAGTRTRAALALPANRGHREMVEAVRGSLDTLGVAVFWVDDDGGTSLDDPRRR